MDPWLVLPGRWPYRKHSGCMPATNQKNQLQVDAEGLRCVIAWGGSRTRSQTLERFRDSMDDKAIFVRDTSNM